MERRVCEENNKIIEEKARRSRREADYPILDYKYIMDGWTLLERYSKL